ncbi:MAG: DUF4097 family beta strand repeat-containing protein [Lachnospiraceae bacterium]
MRKKIQIGIFVFLVGISILFLWGIWYMQCTQRQEKAEKNNEIQSDADLQEPDSEWREEHPIDWDAYFEEGGYFGDYGDNSVSYASQDVTGIRIQAEYATIHVKHSEECSRVEVFTQIGDDRDAISCGLEDGVLNIIQANLDEDAKSDGSYIEVTLPSGKEMDSFRLVQQAGATSLSMNGKIRNVLIDMDSGSIMADDLSGNNLTMDINVANVHIKNAAFANVQFCVREGVLRIDELDVEKRLELLNHNGNMNLNMKKEKENYRFDVSNEDGKVKIDGEKTWPEKDNDDSKALILIQTETGTVSLTTKETE